MARRKKSRAERARSKKAKRAKELEAHQLVTDNAGALDSAPSKTGVNLSESLDTETTADLPRTGLVAGQGGGVSSGLDDNSRQGLAESLAGLPALPSGLLSDVNKLRGDLRDLKSYMQAGVFSDSQIDAMFKKLGVIVLKGKNREQLAAIRLLLSYAKAEREADLARQLAETPKKVMTLDLAKLIENMRAEGKLPDPNGQDPGPPTLEPKPEQENGN